jgi:hypothetical protein
LEGAQFYKIRRVILDYLLAKRRAYLNKKQIREAQSKYRNSQIKKRLVEMFHGKCAYCESKITGVGYGAIEHSRPKSQYIDLAKI